MWPFVMMAAVLFGIAGWVAYTGVFVVHGRFLQPYESINTGADARHWAWALALFGLGLLSPLARPRYGMMAVWMGVCFITAVLVVVVPAYVGH